MEHERPAEWLRWLAETHDAHRLLLEDAGGLAKAAYRLAAARSRVHGGLRAAPTLRELQAAAVMLSRELGMVEVLPVPALLANDCEAQGLPVIRPLPGTPPTSEPPPLRRTA